ncbi:MAG: AI-2E family transporter [Spirochaetaceae bacterium]|jgi:predicted PurR-regulated permease PerM|nr:AI-2E family transporter [Spirochaetaceae bacterium]
MNQPPNSRNIQDIVFGAILVLLFLLVCRLFAPFFTALLWSILFYILINPLHLKLTSSLDRTRPKGKIWCNIWAAVFSLGVTILILLPLSFVGFQIFHQVTELMRQIRDYLSVHSLPGDSSLNSISRFIADLTSDQIVIGVEELRQRITIYISSQLQNLLQFSSSIARNVGSFVAGLVFMVFSLFFFFMDGAYLSKLVLHVIPIRREYIKTLVIKFKDIIRNLVLGYIMVALVQATLAFIIFSIFRVTGSLVFAALTLFCAFIPIFGTGVIWVPLGLIKILNGDLWEGVLFLAVSGLAISMLDNLLRPIFLRDRIQLHPLIIFFAILGGISVFGFNGIILGPMVVILFLTVLDLFLTEHKIEQG